MTIPAPSAERVRALRRMKVVATGLLVLAALVYVLCQVAGDGEGVWGYLQATAEASMVGGLADWFAVTALFRHPLRLPIPHTAIIPEKKDQIGAGLAGFVQEYFLTSEIVGERVAAAHVPLRVGEWLAVPEHAERVAGEVSNAIAGVAEVMHDDELRDAVAAFADTKLRTWDVSPVLGQLLDALREGGQHQAALTATLKGLTHFLDENRTVFRTKVAQESPEWVPEWVDDRVFNKGFTLLQKFLTEVIADPDHGLRHGFDAQLRDLAQRLRDDPEQIAKVEAAKIELLDRPDVHDYLAGLWGSMKKLVLDGVNDPSSELRRSAERLVVRLGEALRDDPDIQRRVDDALQRVVGHVITHYADDLTAVITTTVERWDTEETSRRLELQVGRDLQFIRVNGTVVGALAGLAIYTLTQVF